MQLEEKYKKRIILKLEKKKKNKRTSRGPVSEQNLQEWQTDKTQWENHWLTKPDTCRQYTIRLRSIISRNQSHQ